MDGMKFFVEQLEDLLGKLGGGSGEAEEGEYIRCLV
jgi:hypothetical protein